MSFRGLVTVLTCCITATASATSGSTVPLQTLAAEPKVPFDQDSYLLGYQTYLARGNLPAAYFVARKAVRSQAPDVEWLKRFAQVAEWVGQPSEALDAWLSYAQKSGDQAAWDAVGRLAGGLLNDRALLAYQQQLIQRMGAQDALIDNIMQTYERLGNPREGLAFLDKLMAKQTTPKLLENASLLAERTGQDDRAIALLKQLLKQPQPQEIWALRLAALYYYRSEFDTAWQALHHVKSKMGSQNSQFWKIYADLSRFLNHENEALAAYQMLEQNDRADVVDLQNYVAVLQHHDGLAAARVSERLYFQFGKQYALITALYLYQRERHSEAAFNLLHRLSPEQRQTLQHDPNFLEQRAQLYWQTQQFELARADYEYALQLAPKNIRFVQGLVAVLIDQGDHSALRKILTTAQRSAMNNAMLWSLWASGWSMLQQPERALPFQKAYCRNHPKDQLALLTLASLYTDLGDTEQAQRIQRKVFAQGDASLIAQATSPEQLEQIRHVLFAQRLAAAAPDTALELLRKRLQQPQNQHNRALRDLTLSWLMANDQIDRARIWVNAAYQNHPPHWVAQTLALTDEDRVAMRDLLTQHAAQLPRYDRIEAAIQSDLPHLAEQMAFESLEQHPHDDEQAKRFQYLMSDRGHWLDVQYQNSQQGALQTQGEKLSWSGFIKEYWRLQLNAEQYTQNSQDAKVLRQPTANKTVSAKLSRISTRSTWDVAAAYHQALENYPSLRLGQNYQLESGLSLHWQAEHQTPATDSSTLLAGGMQNAFSGSFNWNITGREYLALQTDLKQFKGQTGQNLGNGQTVTVDIGHYFDHQPSKNGIKLSTRIAQYQADDHPLDSKLSSLVPTHQAANTDFFIPQSYKQIGVYWQFGEAQPEVYQRSWRSFGELGVDVSDTSGFGYIGRLGFHGPVLGYDRLSLSMEQSQSGRDNGNPSKQFLLNYRLFY